MPSELKPYPETLEALADLIGISLEAWPEQSPDVFEALVSLAPVKGARRASGLWAGDMTRHQWFVLPSGPILDPMRWIFAPGFPKKVYVGPNDLYDEGCQSLTDGIRASKPEIYEASKKKSMFFRMLEQVKDRRKISFVLRTLAAEGIPGGTAWLDSEHDQAELEDAEITYLSEKVAPIWTSLLYDDPLAYRNIDAKRMVQSMQILDAEPFVSRSLWELVVQPEFVYCNEGPNGIFAPPKRRSVTRAELFLYIFSRSVVQQHTDLATWLSRAKLKGADWDAALRASIQLSVSNPAIDLDELPAEFSRMALAIVDQMERANARLTDSLWIRRRIVSCGHEVPAFEAMLAGLRTRFSSPVV